MRYFKNKKRSRSNPKMERSDCVLFVEVVIVSKNDVLTRKRKRRGIGKVIMRMLMLMLHQKGMEVLNLCVLDKKTFKMSGCWIQGAIFTCSPQKSGLFPINQVIVIKCC